MRDNGIRGGRGYRLAQAVGLFAFFLSALLSLPRAFAQEKFDYDPLGRLIRYVDRSGYVTEYNYDGAGNILSVVAGAAVAPPSVSRVSASRLRRGTSLAMIVEGSGFSGARLDVQSDGVEIDDVSVSPARIAFSLSASLSAAVGPAVVRISNSVGEARIEVTVDPQLPSFAFLPIPIAIPPDGRNQNVAIELSNVDVHAHQFALTVDSPAVASVSPQLISVAAGQSRSTFAIKGLASGVTTLHARSPTLGDAAVPVFVTAEFAGLNTSHATIVGVVRPVSIPAGSVPTELASAPVVVASGAFLGQISPSAWPIGENIRVAVTGAGLAGVTGVRFDPPSEIHVSELAVAPDGASLSFLVSVAQSALLGTRRLILEGTKAPYPAATGSADRVAITGPQPVIFSIEPLVGLPGQRNVAFTVRGRNLASVEDIVFEPGTGISVDEVLSSNATGTELTTRIAISDAAPAATHVVRVRTPSSVSDAQAASSNRFVVGDGPLETVTPLASPLVGVRKGEADVNSVPLNGVVHSPAAVVAVGAHMESVFPSVVSTGVGRLSLLVRGSHLDGVTAVRLEPQGGITVGPPVVAVDGRSLNVQIDVSADAAIGPRVLSLDGPLAPYVPVTAEGNRLQVTYPLPEIHSVDPIVIVNGRTETLTLRGRNLAGVTAVQLSPGTGIDVSSSISKSSDGTQLSVLLDVEAGAPAMTHVIRLISPIGSTSDVPGAHNAVSVVPSIAYAVTSMPSSLVGVTKGVTPPTAGASEVQVASAAVNVAVGPVVNGLSTRFAYPGTSFDLIIRGVGLNVVDAVSLEGGPDGISLGTPRIAEDGFSVTVPVTVAVNAPSNTYRVVVRAGGQSIPVLIPDAATLDTTLPPGGRLVPDMPAALVGVVKRPASAPDPQVAMAPSPAVLVAAPPYLASIGDAPLIRGSTVSLDLRGAGLQSVTSVVLSPGDGVSVGSVAVESDGSLVRVPLVIAGDAPLGVRRVELRAGDVRVAPLAASLATVSVASGAPDIQSIEPIIAGRGETLSLLIRGAHLHDAREVLIEPATGIHSIGTPVSNASGTELRVPVYIANDAQLGGRVVRVRAAGGISSGDAAPANTLTLYDNN